MESFYPELNPAFTLRFRVVCVHLVPCVSLVILNILLFSAIRKAERRRQKLMASRVKAEQAGLVKRWITKYIDCHEFFQWPVEIGTTSDRETRTARPWCWSWSLRCSCRWRRRLWSSRRFTPSRQGGETQSYLKFRNLSELFSSVTDFLDYDLAKRLVFIINLCIYLSYPLNFAIYCGMSRRVKITTYYFVKLLIKTLSYRQFRDTFRLIIVTPVVKKFSSDIKMDQQTNENEDSSTKLTKSRR